MTTIENRKRNEFRKLMESKWYNGKPIEWMLDEETLQEVDDFLTYLMAEIRQDERSYIIKEYEISGYKLVCPPTPTKIDNQTP